MLSRQTADISTEGATERAKVLFVVEYVLLNGGSDFIPGGRNVVVRRLKADGARDPYGEKIVFCMNG